MFFNKWVFCDIIPQNDVHLIKKDEKVGASESTLLNMLKISPFSYGLQIEQGILSDAVSPHRPYCHTFVPHFCCQSACVCPIFLKLGCITNFDVGFISLLDKI